jgi:hypothetical protein
MVEMAESTKDKPADEKPAAPQTTKQAASSAPDMRIRAMEMALDFHKGMNPDPQKVVTTAKAILDFVNDTPPE